RVDYVLPDELKRVAESGCAIELHGPVRRYPNGAPAVFDSDLAARPEVIVQYRLPEPRHYCYPSGNFDSVAEGVLKQHEVRSAVTCVPGLVRSRDNRQRYFLPRFLDGEHISTLEFEAELSGFAALLRYI